MTNAPDTLTSPTTPPEPARQQASGTSSADPKTMRAAVVAAPMKIRIVEAPTPQPGNGQVRVRIEGCGVCASNIPPWEGREWFRYPLEPGQLGHEAWGVIDAVGADITEHHVGQRVAFLSDHAYAEYDLADASKVLPLPQSLAGKPFPAEPLACAINVFRRGSIAAGQTVAIVGIGFLGALLTRMASDAGAKVIGIARRDFARQIARSMGASRDIPLIHHAQIISAVASLTGGAFCDVVIEAVGKQWPLDLSAELTRERGRLVIAGYHQDGPRQVNMQLWNWRGIDVINAHERDPRVYLGGMRAAVEAVAGGRLDPTPLLTHRFCLEGLGEALEMTRERPDGFMKALIMM